jgi:hypothetical protein
MVQIVEILTDLEGKNQKENILKMDFDKFGDLIMDIIEDEAYMKMTFSLMNGYNIFHQQRCWTIAKFLVCVMEENFEIGKKSELAKKYKDYKVNKFMDGKDNDLNQELLLLNIKLMMIRNLFRDSINYLDFGTETEMFSFDEEAGQILMGKLKDRKLQDPEFAAVPARIENYEDAEKTSKLITKLASKRVYLAEKYPNSVKVANDYMLESGRNSIMVHAPILLKMKEFYPGFVYYAAGKFHPSEAMKYKMIRKALGYWDTFSKSDFSSIPEIHVELE